MRGEEKKSASDENCVMDRTAKETIGLDGRWRGGLVYGSFWMDIGPPFHRFFLRKLDSQRAGFRTNRNTCKFVVFMGGDLQARAVWG